MPAPQRRAVIERLEAPGTIEMRVLAGSDYDEDEVQFDIAGEQARLEQWLDQAVPGGDRTNREMCPARARTWTPSADQIRHQDSRRPSSVWRACSQETSSTPTRTIANPARCSHSNRSLSST